MSTIKTSTIVFFIFFLVNCSNKINLKEGQALLNPISTTIYTPTSKDKIDLKIISINNKPTSIFSNRYIVNIGEVAFLVRCYYKNRKSFTKFKLNLKNKKVYNIKAKVTNQKTIFYILVNGKTIATKSAKNKLFNRDGINF